MSDATHAPRAERPFPRAALLVGGAMIAVSLAAAVVGTSSGFGTMRTPATAATEYRDLRFADRDDGAVVVSDATNGRTVLILPSQADGFIRGVLRSLVRERRSRGLGDEMPFRLLRSSDGRLVLRDRATGTEIVLNAFGPTNVEAFARFLANGEGRR